MAYVVESVIARTDGTAAASITFETWFSQQQAGDYIIVCAANDGGGTVLGIDVGWTPVGTAPSNNGARSGIWWRKVSGALPAPTITGANDEWACAALLVRDAPDVADATWIDTFDQLNQTSNTTAPVAPAVTTSEDDVLILRFVARDGGGLVMPNEGWGAEFIEAETPDTRFSTAVNVQLRIASTLAKTAGVVSAATYYSAVSDGGTSWTLAIRNKAGGGVPHGVEGAPNVVASYLTTPSPYDMLTRRATIAGVSVIATTTTATVVTTQVTNDAYFYGQFRALQWNSNNATGMCGIGHAIPETDFTSGLYCVYLRASTASSSSILGPLFYFEDANGNWAVFRFGNRVYFNGYPTVIQYLPDATPVDSSGVMDWTRIVHVGYITHVISAASTVRSYEVRFLCLLPFASPLRVVGGSPANPVTSRALIKALTGGGAWRAATGLGVGLNVINIPCGFGNGSTPTYVVDEAQSLEYPADGSPVSYAAGAGNQTLHIKASAGDTILLDAGVKAAGTRQKLRIDAASSLAAEYGTAGAFIGFDVESIDGFTWTGATFSKCFGVLGRNSEFINCVFKASNAQTAALELSSGASVFGSRFTRGAEPHAIELTEPGSYAILECVFSGYTLPLYISATTGTVTITLALGDPEPAYISDGATVVFDQPTVLPTLTISGFESGSDVVVYDAAAASTGDGSNVIQTFNEVAGTSAQYTYTYAPGAAVDIGVFKPGRVPLMVRGVPLGTANATLPVSQQEDRNYVA